MNSTYRLSLLQDIHFFVEKRQLFGRFFDIAPTPVSVDVVGFKIVEREVSREMSIVGDAEGVIGRCEDVVLQQGGGGEGV